MSRRPLPLLALALLTAPALAGPTADRVVEGVRQYRAEAGRDGPTRVERLDEAAEARARRIAALPERQRLALRENVGDDVRATGLRLFGELRTRIDLSRGFRDPASAIVAKWLRADGWADAMDPRFDLVGAADVTADDGTLVFVLILIESPAVPDDVAELERRAEAAVNAARAERGLAPLAPEPTLRDVARLHSRDMAARDYFSHRSPDGTRPADRLRAAGLAYAAVAENIQMSRGVRDPVRTAVDAWMESRGHRRNILDPDYTEGAIGVHVGDDGRVWFTQLFRRPP